MAVQIFNVIWRISSLCICFLACAEGGPAIIEPWPYNLYPIEGENIAVTCVAFDENDPNGRPVIKFARNLDLGGTKQITDEGPNGHTYFTTEKKMDGRKVSTTLHINNVTLNDDTKNGGSYQCEAYASSAPGATADDVYGFTITVIKRSEIPKIQVSEDETVKFGDSVSLGCNLTDVGTNKLWNPIDHIAWIKDNKLIDETFSPEKKRLDNLEVKIDSPEDAGIFTCVLTAKLRNIRPYKIYGNITVQVTPHLFRTEVTTHQFYKGDPGKMVCSAQGNPIEVTWKRKDRNDKQVVVLNQTEPDNRYSFSNSGYRGFTLTINPLEYMDRGSFYCCIKGENNTNTEDTTGCQEFLLRVKALPCVRGVSWGHFSYKRFLFFYSERVSIYFFAFINPPQKVLFVCLVFC
ncbi:uncharacterized protein LOC5505659 isoform X1 [Nematostella vectensis]|uniref:uncharacterized protein LOC5505659 isoform X1 n=1 Tax=Nematostella vectensis TaxID=45351 RepID=UPI0020778A55|nr:uncharacterized protein LOC5505659 isoform X1 [Nematostella vectensis]